MWQIFHISPVAACRAGLSAATLIFGKTLLYIGTGAAVWEFMNTRADTMRRWPIAPTHGSLQRQ
jgi:hypothetical protein